MTMSTRYAMAAVEHLARRHFLASRKAAGEPTPFEQIRQQNIFEVLEYLSWKHVWDGNDEPFEVQGLIPVRVYLPEEDQQAQADIAAAITHLAAAFDLEIAFEFREVRSSWLKTWFLNVHGAVSALEVAQRLTKLEGPAVTELLRASGAARNAIIQMGPYLIIKRPTPGAGGLHVRTLTPDDLARLELNPSLIVSGFAETPALS
jgi:hypothetical protein